MLPLSGLRVIAVEQYGAGPFGSMMLGDLGAEVIKIENPAEGGDVSRSVGPYFFANGDSHFFQAFNRNKKSVTLNLKRPQAKEVLHRLVRSADATFDNLRGDQPEKLGLTYAQLAEVNPKIVCAHLSAYGRDGERKSWPGYDYLMQAEAGYLGLSGEPDGPPARMGLSIVDYATGTTCALALLAGMIEARRTGKGRDLDVSLYDVSMHMLSYPAAWYLNEGLQTKREPRSAHPAIVPSQLYRTKDGWIFVMAQTQRFWERLCDVLGHPELAERFPDFASRREHRDELTTLLDAELSRHTTAEWLSRLRGTVPCGPVLDLASALDNPYFLARGGVQVLDHPEQPGFKLVASPFRIGEPLPAQPAPTLGQHTLELLRSLGYDAAEIGALGSSGALG